MVDLATAHHAAPILKCIPSIQYVYLGVSYMTAIISGAAALVAGFGLGWYVKGRGITGVQTDLNNVKTDVANIKTQLSAATAKVA
jgi:hypothetical protein